jgi:predicted dehydrogenase
MQFHNAFGPVKSWFYDAHLSGGGCLLDLGIHLIDLALWCLDFPEVKRATGNIVERSRVAGGPSTGVEDYASAELELETGTSVQFSCSWKAPAGCDALISLTFFGTEGGVSFRNVNGSFYDFIAEHFWPDRSRHVLVRPPENWGGLAAIDWVKRLSISPSFDPEVKHLRSVAKILDRIYGGKG